MARKQEIGKRGEDFAADFLQAAGYQILARNWRCSFGEIDIIAGRAGIVAFVEVKTRSSLAYGHPFEAITAEKSVRLRKLALQWLIESSTSVREIRIDGISVLLAVGQQPQIEHLEGIGS